MNFFKEIWTFVRLLFTRINTDKVEPLAMKHFPFSGYAYIMWCGKIIYREDKKYLANPSAVDMNHENIHLEQAKDKGTWAKYYLSYLWHWVKNNPFSSSAYYLIPEEVEAYAKENDLSYIERRSPGMVSKYKLIYPKKVWKQVGSSSYAFKKFIKEIFEEY